MRTLLCLLAGLLAAFQTRAGDIQLPVLHTTAATYTNVTVTMVTPTDIFFIHSQGGGNAKLKDLSPDLQKRFGYDPAKAAAAEKARWQANSLYLSNTLATPPPARTPDSAIEIPHPVIHAKSYLDQKPPDLIVQQWLTDKPEMNGKFLMVDFWLTGSPVCQAAITDLNRYDALFHNQLAIVGLSDEVESDDLRMKLPKILYSLALDPQGRTRKAMDLTEPGHCLIIDPRGIVRYEGSTTFLNEQILRALFEKYGN